MKPFLALSTWLLIATFGANSFLSAQETEDDNENEDAIESIQQIEDTDVVGRPAPFPANPLEENTVVTPNRTENLVSEVASSLTVITQAEIQEKRQSSVAEVLRGVPGLDVARSGGPGGLTSVFLRGANSNQTKVLIDGIPVNDPSSAGRGFDFSHLTIDNIEQIEVLRGPQSILYGTDAIGGVINIITKRGEGPLQFKATGQTGSYGSQETRLNMSGGTDTVYYSLSGSYFDSDGFSAGNQARGNVEDDSFRNGVMAGRFGWTPSEVFSIDYVTRWTDADTAVDDLNFFGPPPVIDNFTRRNRLENFLNRVQATSLLLDGAIETKAGFSLVNYHRHDTAGFDPSFNGQTRQFDYESVIALTDNNWFTAGVDFLHEQASSTFYPTVRNQNLGVYIQDRFVLGERAVATGGVRFIDHSSAGAYTTYRATAQYSLPETDSVLHGSIGTGFRAPALAENFFFAGNPDLRPERSQGWDAGVRQSFVDDLIIVDVTYFNNIFADLIFFNNTFTRLENINSARASGVELHSTIQLTSDLTMTANYTFTKTEDVTNGGPLARRAPNKAYVALNQFMFCDQANLNLYMLYVDKRLDTRFNQEYLDPYITVNLSGSYRWTEHVEFFARADNLFNEKYEEVFGYGTPGASVFGGINLIR